MSTSEILLVKWDVGAHMGFSSKITPTIAQAIEQGMYTTQFFMGGTTTKTRQKINGADISDTQCMLSRYPTNVFTHFPFIANLNGSVDSLAWAGDAAIDSKLEYTMNQLEYELSVISQFSESKSGVVIHPGCYPDVNKGLACIAKTINKLNFTQNGKLILENCAGEGRKLCKNFTEISRIIDQVQPSKRSNIGVCVDTAHIWGQGDYDIRKISEIDRMFSDFDAVIGLDKFALLHLNDSEVPCGSKKDRHACLCTGHIWTEDSSSLVYLLDKCQKHGIPMVLETDVSDMITLAKL